jgi:hypothetical protein
MVQRDKFWSWTELALGRVKWRDMLQYDKEPSVFTEAEKSRWTAKELKATEENYCNTELINVLFNRMKAQLCTVTRRVL